MKTWTAGTAAVVALFSLVALCHAQEQKTLSFAGDGELAGLEITGGVSIDPAKNHEGGAGGALKLEPGSRAIWRLRDASGAGKVEMWIYEDASAPAEPKKYAASPMWGLVQADGPVLTVGPVYAPYLSGDKTYATADFTPDTNERAWQQVQYLGIKRDVGWHKWAFVFDLEKGLTIMHNDADINAQRETFNWPKTRLKGMSGVAFFGDTSDAKQTLWVDDISVSLGEEGTAAALWPPPPPAELQVVAPQAAHSTTPYAQWEHGLSKDPNYFPIAVWLQTPENAKRYKEAGINLYIGLWKGPTEEQLALLKEAGMPVICDQNEVGLAHIDDPLIVGWMHGDEPDNAHKFDSYWGKDKEKIKDAWPEIYERLGLATKDYRAYGPPVPPKWIISDYAEIKKNDPSRPVMINLGQGVAWEAFGGRGERTGHLEDYSEYIKGCDIISYDIYPASHSTDYVRGNLWYQALGVSRLRTWTADRKPAWNCLECTRISNPSVKPTPHQVRAQAWMAIVHGSRGFIYFVHQFKPTFIEAGLLAEPELLAAVTDINRQVTELAPVINSATIADGVKAESSDEHTPIHAIAKRSGDATYVFSVAMYHLDATATFTVNGVGATATAEVIGEDRTIEVKNGKFRDSFGGYDVHLYRIQ